MKYQVTVRKIVELTQTYTLDASTERDARRRAKEMADECDASTKQSNWRVTKVVADAPE